MPRRLSAAVALFLAALVGTTACSGGQSPPAPTTAAPVESTASASPGTTSATPTAAPAYKPADASGRAQNVPVPVLPEAAKAETKEGLEAFAKYWYSTLNYAYETGDLTPIGSISDPSCALCGRVFPGIQKWNADGKWIIGSTVAVQAVQSKFVRTADGSFQVVIQSQQQSGSLRNADGTEAQQVQPSTVLGDLMIAKFANGEWKALNVDRLGS